MTTKIQWTQETWNLIVGCSRISEGCKNCYAATAAKSARLQQFSQYQKVKDWDGRVEFVESQWLKPLGWKQPKLIFGPSMSDPWHKNVPDEWVDKKLAVAVLCPQHTFQILTKRPDRMEKYFASTEERLIAINYWVSQILGKPFDTFESRLLKLPLPNVWLGTSVENQDAANKRIRYLIDTPAVRFLSLEPLLEQVDLSEWLPSGKLHQLIIGGESGTGARECNLDWIRFLVNQGLTAKVDVFVKQLGSCPMDGNIKLKLADKKGGDLTGFPELNIRQLHGVKA